jgi:hypothetical protein
MKKNSKDKILSKYNLLLKTNLVAVAKDDFFGLNCSMDCSSCFTVACHCIA